MADADFTVHIRADDEASSQIDKVADAGEQLEQVAPVVEVSEEGASEVTTTLDDITALAEDVGTTTPVVEVSSEGGEEVVGQLGDIVTAADDVGFAAPVVNISETGASEVVGQLGDVLDSSRELEDLSALKFVLESNAREIQSEMEDLLDSAEALDASNPEISVIAGELTELNADLGDTNAEIQKINEAAITISTDSAVASLQAVSSAAGEAQQAAEQVGNGAAGVSAVGDAASAAASQIGQVVLQMGMAAASGKKLSAILRPLKALGTPGKLITTALTALNNTLKIYKQNAAEAAATTDELAAAMTSGANSTEAVSDHMRDNAKELKNFSAASANLGGDFAIAAHEMASGIPIIGKLVDKYGELGNVSVDVVDAMQRSGISVHDFAAAATEGGAASDEFNASLEQAKDSGAITSDEYKSLKEAMSEYSDSAGKAADKTKLLHRDQEAANASLQATLAQQEPLSQMSDQWSVLMDDMRDGSIDTEAAATSMNVLAEGLNLTQEQVEKIALDELNAQAKASAEAAEKAAEAYGKFAEAVGSDAWGDADLTGGLAAMSEFSSQMFGLTDINMAYQESVDAMSASLKENGNTFDVSTEKGRANQVALEGVAEVMDVKLAAAYANSNGDMNAFTTGATEGFNQLVKDMGLSGDQAAVLQQKLGLLPEDLQTRFEMSGDAEAIAKLDLLQGAISALPKETQLQIGAMIAQDDFTGALALAQSSLAAGAPLPVYAVDEATGPINAIEDAPYDTTINTDAETGDAESGIEAVESAKYQATIDSVAETAAAAGELLDVATQPRVAEIVALVMGAFLASMQLNGLTTPRTAPVTVALPNIGSANQQLDNLARPRSASINVNVHQTTTLTRVDGGG